MRPNRDVAAGGERLLIRTRRLALRGLNSIVLAGALCALLLLAGAAGLLSRQFAAPFALAAPFPAQPPQNVSLVSPSSGQGPVGAKLTVQGSDWTSSIVTVGIATSTANCANPTAGSDSGWIYTVPAAVGTTNGSFTFSFTWPASLTAGSPYYLCAAPGSQPPNGSGVPSQQTFTVRSSQPPTLSLSSSTVQVGQPFTITGNNFYGVPSVTISINNVFNQSATPDSNGSFIVTVTPTAGQAGNANILAQSPPEGNNPPVLTAVAQITVLGAPTVTPDPSPSPSPSPSVDTTSTAASSGGTLGTTSTDSGGGGGLIIALIIAILLVLAAIAGAVTFLVLRRRGGPGREFPGGPGSGGPGGPGGDWGGYSGPGRGTGPVPQFGQTATGRYSATGAYGPTGYYPQPDPYASQQVGGVAQWDDAPQTGGVAAWDDREESVPGPDWQPRPMSNNRRRYDDPSYPSYAAPDEPPVDPYGGVPTAGGYPPPDPWGGATGGYTNPPPGYVPPGRATGYPPNPAHGQPPDDSYQNDDWNPGGGGGRGPSGTNPANQGW